MTGSATSGTPANQLPVQSPVQGPPVAPVDAATGVEAPGSGSTQCELSPAWRDRLGTALWQLGSDPDAVDAQLDAVAAAGLGEPELEQLFGAIAREVALRHANPAWNAGSDVSQVPGQFPGGPLPPGQRPPTQGPLPPTTGPGPGPGLPPGGTIPPPSGSDPGTPPDGSVPPPGSGPGTPPDGSVPPPGSGPGTPPIPGTPPGGSIPPPDSGPGTPPIPGTPPGSEWPPVPGPNPDPDPVPPPPPGEHHGSLTPWLVGAGILGAGALGALAFVDGARNVRALRATAAAFESGSMHQGGLQAINDARLGARFTGGIGFGSYLSVATPVVNRIGTAGRLTSVARGHLDHAELMAAATAMQRGVGDAVSVHEPTRAFVLDGLEHGRSMGSLLDDLHRSAGGAKPSFDNPQLLRYADQTSIVERGPRGPQDITSGLRQRRPELALERGAVTSAPTSSGSALPSSASDPRGPNRIVATGGEVDVDSLIAGRGARLGGRGLASGIGTVQGLNVSSLPPGLQARAVAASGVDPAIVSERGLDAGYTARWHERLTPPAGPPNPAP